MANYLVPSAFGPGKYPSDRSVHRRSGDGGRRFRADGQRTRPERPVVTHLAEFGSDDFVTGSTIGPDGALYVPIPCQID